MNKFSLILLSIFLFLTTATSFAQPTLKKDFSYMMEIPSVVTMDSSPAHLYVLSQTEGMVVFRTRPDSLQWLYSSTGMEQRGTTMSTDVRFAYLFGNSRRLTVLEPTSVLGVYSSTYLPSNPRDAERIGQNLYVAMGEKGLGKVSLKSPAAVDSMITFVRRSKLSNAFITDLETSSNQLFALSDDQMLYRFKQDPNEGELTLEREFKLPNTVDHIFLINNTLFGSDKNGHIYEIDGQGNLASLGNIGEPVDDIEQWKDWLIIRGSSQRLWTSYKNRSPKIWKEDQEAGNYIAVTDDDLWLCEYNQISRIIAVNNAAKTDNTVSKASFTGDLSLSTIPNQNIPHSKSLLVPISFNSDIPANAVTLTYQSDNISDAKIRGRSLYWKPGSNDVGRHRLKVIATTSGGQTDSTSFTINVRSFNAPPRFAPIRPISIPAGEKFTLPIQATDPDGTDKELVRFLGVDMPDGASINEATGLFSWTPKARQVGENTFRIIATDQYGAAKSVDITINVIENIRDNNSEN